jgi:soluble lytic murein transglycosylase-like protein
MGTAQDIFGNLLTWLRQVMILAKVLICCALAVAVTKSPVPRQGIPIQAQQYRATLVREAHAAGGLAAPVTMFAAQLHQESNWKPTARSGVGAIGLAQFMPATAAWMANLYPADLKPGAPYDPEWAIRALVRYDLLLAKQLPKFKAGDDRYAAALSAYNGGLGWVYKDQKAATCDASLWFACVSGVPDIRTAANYKQNRDYPVRILLKIRPLYVAAGW